MTCENCENLNPGSITEIDSKGRCIICGKDLVSMRLERSHIDQSKWDIYFHQICESVASKSPCLSRKIGALLVKDHSVVSTGYNGPPRGVPHCGHERFMKDDLLVSKLHEKDNPNKFTFNNVCPRRALEYASGEGMQWCPAQHAEENVVSNAARLGVSVLGSTLYMNSVIPCQKCYGTLINAGIAEIVVDSAEFYDKHTEFLIKNSVIKIREFEI